MKQRIISLGSSRAPESTYKLYHLVHPNGVSLSTVENNLAQEKCIGEHRWLKVLSLPSEINFIEIYLEAEEISLRQNGYVFSQSAPIVHHEYIRTPYPSGHGIIGDLFEEVVWCCDVLLSQKVQQFLIHDIIYHTPE